MNAFDIILSKSFCLTPLMNVFILCKVYKHLMQFLFLVSLLYPPTYYFTPVLLLVPLLSTRPIPTVSDSHSFTLGLYDLFCLLSVVSRRCRVHSFPTVFRSLSTDIAVAPFTRE